MIIKRTLYLYRGLAIQVKASMWFLVCSFLQKGISMITTPIFTRLMTTTEYGQYSVFNSWLNIVTIVVSLNLYAGVFTQGLVKFKEERSVFASSLQGLTTVMVLAWTIIYIPFRFFFNSLLTLTTVQVIAMLAMIWSTAAFNFWACEKRVLYSYKTLVIVTLLISFAKPAVGICAVILSEDKVTARILGLALVELVGYSGLYFTQMLRGKKFFSGKFWAYALKFNIPLIPHYLSTVVLSSADRIMIKNMVGANEAGIYGLAYSISLIMTLFNTALSQTISPWIYQKIKDKRINDIANVGYVTLIIIAFVNIVLILFAPEIVAIFAPSEYYSAIWVIPPVAMSVFFLFSYDLFAKFAFYYEKTFFIMSVSVVGAVLNLLLNYIFIQKYGFIAAGYTTLFCYVIFSVGHYIFMKITCKKHCDGVYPYETRIIVGIACVFLLCSFFMLFTYEHPFIRYSIIAIMLLFLLIYRKRIKGEIMNLASLKIS